MLTRIKREPVSEKSARMSGVQKDGDPGVPEDGKNRNFPPLGRAGDGRAGWERSLFIASIGPSNVHPTNIDWLMHADYRLHFLGWHLYRARSVDAADPARRRSSSGR